MTGLCRVCHKRLELNKKNGTIPAHDNKYVGGRCKGWKKRAIDENKAE